MTAPAQQQQSNAATYAVTVAAAARAVQLAIRAALLRDVAKLWPMLDPKRVDETFGPWLTAMSAVIGSYRGQSATAAGRFYQSVRAHALQSPTPASLIQLAPAAEPELLQRAFGYAGPGMLSRDTARPNTALSTTLGTAARIVMDAGRQTTVRTVENDPAAVGWYRITDGAPCAFCALMASRGIVYKDEKSAGRNANRRFEGEGEFKYHNDCGCDAAPAFSRDQPLPELSRRAAQVYLERGDGDALKAFRKSWDAHQKARESA